MACYAHPIKCGGVFASHATPIQLHLIIFECSLMITFECSFMVKREIIDIGRERERVRWIQRGYIIAPTLLKIS